MIESLPEPPEPDPLDAEVVGSGPWCLPSVEVKSSFLPPPSVPFGDGCSVSLGGGNAVFSGLGILVVAGCSVSLGGGNALFSGLDGLVFAGGCAEVVSGDGGRGISVAAGPGVSDVGCDSGDVSPGSKTGGDSFGILANTVCFLVAITVDVVTDWVLKGKKTVSLQLPSTCFAVSITTISVHHGKRSIFGGGVKLVLVALIVTLVVNVTVVTTV